jgi:hypothetical protein
MVPKRQEPTYHSWVTSDPVGEVLPTPPADPAPASASETTVRVLRTEPELASVREDWLRMKDDQISADPDFFAASLRADPKIVRPHVLALVRAGVVAALLVGRVEKVRLSVRLGYRTLFAPLVYSITVVYGGILGDLEPEAFALLLASLRGSLAAREADVAIFRYLPIDSRYYRIATRETSLFMRQHVAEPETHWELDLPASVDDLLRARSRVTRHSLARSRRKLEREYGERLEIRRFTETADIDAFFEAVEAIAPKTYQHRLGVSFGDTPSHRERMLFCLQRGWYRGYVLYLDGRPVAFEHGALYEGRFRSGRPGYDPDFAHLSVGTYLFLHALEDLCADDAATLVDHGIGDADYKRRFGTRSRLEANLILYAPTFKAARINLARTALLKGVLATRRLAGHGELAHNVRRRWREHLQRANGG